MMITTELFFCPAQAGFFQIALPLYFAAHAAEGSLLVGFHKKAQTGFNSRPLRVCAAAAHRLTNELIIYFDVAMIATGARTPAVSDLSDLYVQCCY
jgi:hypothetical protein